MSHNLSLYQYFMQYQASYSIDRRIITQEK
nr:MAG TPA: hypothetical protein [Caudoviricetes sp.]DAX56934.1 MAG TPA: hypothetical protein [Caudoviricetes sp.]